MVAPQSVGCSSRELNHRVIKPITINNMPAHSHSLNASSETGTNSSPAGDVLAQTPGRIYTPNPPNAVMNGAAIGQMGGNQPISTVPPTLAVHYIIALQGTYPSR